MASRVLALFAHPPAPAAPPFPELTEREREILDRIARGDSNHAIADGLRLSPKTIANIVSNIFTKLRVHDRAQAVIQARDAGLGQPPPPGPR